MSKVVTFKEETIDKELVKKIKAYQKQKKLNSFTQAVRQLCDIGLKFDEIKMK